MSSYETKKCFICGQQENVIFVNAGYCKEDLKKYTLTEEEFVKSQTPPVMATLCGSFTVFFIALMAILSYSQVLGYWGTFGLLALIGMIYVSITLILGKDWSNRRKHLKEDYHYKRAMFTITDESLSASTSV